MLGIQKKQLDGWIPLMETRVSISVYFISHKLQYIIVFSYMFILFQDCVGPAWKTQMPASAAEIFTDPGHGGPCCAWHS